MFSGCHFDEEEFRGDSWASLHFAKNDTAL